MIVYIKEKKNLLREIFVSVNCEEEFKKALNKITDATIVRKEEEESGEISSSHPSFIYSVFVYNPETKNITTISDLLVFCLGTIGVMKFIGRAFELSKKKKNLQVSL